MEGRSDASSFLNSSNGDSPTLYSNGLNAVQQRQLQQQYHHPYEHHHRVNGCQLHEVVLGVNVLDLQKNGVRRRTILAVIASV
jgi:hypothetical protein